MKASYVLVGLIFAGTLGCIPEHLRKYRSANQQATSERNNEPAADMTPSTSRATPEVVQPKREPPSIYAIDEKTFRFSLAEDQIWDAALNVLLRNYNLTIVDKNSGVITTELDTFFLNQEAFRNKVSIRIQRNSRNSCDVMIHNSVEKLTNGVATGAVGAVWLPSNDEANEVHRIVRNMAILLNQPPPFIPGGNVAVGPGQVNEVN